MKIFIFIFILLSLNLYACPENLICEGNIIFANNELKELSLNDLEADNIALDFIHVRSATITNMHLRKGSISQAILTNIQIKDSHFDGIDFTQTNFVNGVFIDSSFINCNFSNVNLKHANLESSFLGNSIFVGAIYNDQTKLPFSKEEAIKRGMIYVP